MFALRYQGSTHSFILVLFRIHYLVLILLSFSVSHIYTGAVINNSKNFNALISKIWLLHAFRVPDDLGTNFRDSISYSLSSL